MIPSCSFWRVPLFLEHVALHRHRLRDCHRTPVRSGCAAWLAACLVGTWQRRVDDKKVWGGAEEGSPHSTGGNTTQNGVSVTHPPPVGYRQQMQGLFLVRAHLGSSAGLGQAQLTLARAAAYNCSPKSRLCLWHFCEWKNAHLVATVRWGKKENKLHRPRVLTC